MSSLPFGSSGEAMAAGLVVGAGAFHRRVVLRDVEIDRPGAQRRGQLLQRVVELAPGPTNRNPPAGCASSGRCSPWCRAACGPCRPGSRAFRAVDRFEQIHHLLPTVHAAPADFAFGGEPLAEVFGDVARFAERLGDQFLVALRDPSPIRRGWQRNRCAPRRKAARRSRGASARCGRPCGPGATNCAALVSAAHGRTAAGGRPDRRDHRAHHEAFASESCRRDVSGHRR